MTTLVSDTGSSWIGHQQYRCPVGKCKLCFHASNNIHILAPEVILSNPKSVRAGVLDSDICLNEFFQSLTVLSPSQEQQPSDSESVPTSADHCRQVSIAGDPGISGVNGAGMLFQSQDIAVRAAEVRVCERALRKVVGRCWLPINHS